MKHFKHGFTIIELVVVILIGSILTSIAFSSFTTVMGRFAVRGARDTFVTLHARARTQAIERASMVHLFASASGDSVVIRAGTTVLEMVDFDSEMDVDLLIAGDSVRLCMNSRGYAESDCNSFSTTATIRFVQGGDTLEVVILPLGQLVLD